MLGTKVPAKIGGFKIPGLKSGISIQLCIKTKDMRDLSLTISTPGRPDTKPRLSSHGDKYIVLQGL